MATPPISDAEVKRTIQAMSAAGGNQVQAAAILGISRGALQGRIQYIGRLTGEERKLQDEVKVQPPPPADEPMEDLLARKRAGFARSLEYEKWAKQVPVQVKDDKPIAVMLIGDPHLDDDHCDIGRLEADLAVIRRTKGMFAGHLGDFTNNWVGRLARLHAHQSTTFNDGLRLVEWMFKQCPSLFAVNGNHDDWEHGSDILAWIVRAGVHRSDSIRLAMTWPNGKKITLHARHDFPGRSQFSQTHGMKRELLFGFKDDIKVAGHLHTDEARVEPSHEGAVHWLLRVSGYKVIDKYAEQNNFHSLRLAPSCTVVLKPDAMPAERVKPFWDHEEAADYLTFIRKRTR